MGLFTTVMLPPRLAEIFFDRLFALPAGFVTAPSVPRLIWLPGGRANPGFDVGGDIRSKASNGSEPGPGPVTELSNEHPMNIQ